MSCDPLKLGVDAEVVTGDCDGCEVCSSPPELPLPPKGPPEPRRPAGGVPKRLVVVVAAAAEVAFAKDAEKKPEVD